MNQKPADCLVIKPRHKWFSNYDKQSDDGWWGPHDTIEQAAMESVVQNGHEHRIFVTQGRKLRKAEQYSEFKWEVDALRAFEIVIQ